MFKKSTWRYIFAKVYQGPTGEILAETDPIDASVIRVKNNISPKAKEYLPQLSNEIGATIEIDPETNETLLRVNNPDSESFIEKYLLFTDQEIEKIKKEGKKLTNTIVNTLNTVFKIQDESPSIPKPFKAPFTVDIPTTPRNTNIYKRPQYPSQIKTRR